MANRAPYADEIPPPDAIMAMGVVALTEAIAAKQVSCVEVMQASLDRIKLINPLFNPIPVLGDADQLVAAAQAYDMALARYQQDHPGQLPGALYGVPQAIKDLAPAKGFAFSRGSPLFKDLMPAEDGLVVARARQAGAIIIGKTNTPEFGFGSHTYNPVYGITRNAYNRALTAGGSSGGAAVALAHCCLSVADGSDMGGSLRNPGAFNNVYGFRPSQGRVPMWPNLDPYFSQMGVEGPMARSLDDLALLLSVQAGWDVRSPLALAGDGQVFKPPLARIKTQGVKVGWVGDWDGLLAYEPGILALCQAKLVQWQAFGIEVVPVAMGFDLQALWQAWVHLRSAAVATSLGALYRQPDKRALLKPEAQWEIEQGMALSAEQLHQAAMVRAQWYARYVNIMQAVDFLAAPTSQVWPFKVETTWPRSINGVPMDTYHRWMQGVSPWTLAGAPVLNVPVGFSDELPAATRPDIAGPAVPMGMQIIGAPTADLAVLQLAASLH
jgi:amidase